MGKKNLIYSALIRMAVLLPSVCCALLGVAQTSLSDRLYQVLISQDIELGLKLYREITLTDLQQLPDSSLFNYHYLGGWYNSEISNHEKAIEHCLEAKRLCESHLGIHNYEYVEIVEAIGREYKKLGKYEDALAFYEEGIVKSYSRRKSVTVPYCNLLSGIIDCLEFMGYFNEIPSHLWDAWYLWDKDESPLVTYTYYPLWCLHQFYRRYEMYDNAIKVSDEIIKFIIDKAGSNYPILAEELYFRGNTLSDMGKSDEAIETYRKGLDILESNKLEYDDNYSYYPILGNLLLILIKNKRWDDSEIVLDMIKKYGETIGNEDKYNITLTAVANVLCNDGHYDKALKFSSELLERKLTDERKQTAEWLKEEILYGLEVTGAIPELEILLKNSTFASNEWCDTAFNLISAYFRKKDTEKAIVLLNSMYQAVALNNAAKDEYIISILGTLYNVCLEQGDYNLALKYALENKEYIYTIPNVPERLRFYCMNNIVVAKLKSNKLDGIYEDWDETVSLCRNVFGEDSEGYAIQLHNKGRALQLGHKYDEAKQHYLDAIALDIKVKGQPSPETVKYLIETNEQLTDAELDL